MQPPGESVTIEVSRSGKPVTLTAKVGSATAARTADNATPIGTVAAGARAVRPLTEEERAQAGTDAGLLVQGVQGRAAAAGIQQGDVVLAVDGTEVKNIDQLRSCLTRGKERCAADSAWRQPDLRSDCSRLIRDIPVI